jgi:hypothetical protein
MYRRRKTRDAGADDEDIGHLLAQVLRVKAG